MRHQCVYCMCVGRFYSERIPYDLTILRVLAAGPIKVYNYNKISGQDNIITSSRNVRKLSFDTVTTLKIVTSRNDLLNDYQNINQT